MGRELTIGADRTGGAVDGDLVAVEVAAHVRHGLAAGAVVERLGSLKTERAVSLIAIHAHGIPHTFTGAVIAEADAARPAGTEGREDWRDLPLVTIDPPDAKDHDDAVHALPDPDPRNAGGYIVSVAIADVAHYVRPDSALDRAAAERGNSVYFPDRVVPMLPRAHLQRSVLAAAARGSRCARRAHGDRCRRPQALAHIPSRLDPLGGAAVTTSRRSSRRPAAPTRSPNRLMQQSLSRFTQRIARCAVLATSAGRSTSNLPERKILLRSDGTVDRVVMPRRLDAHRLIEEFMILANVAAAETCERARVPLIYRVHDEPSPEKLNALREFLGTLDISLPKGGALRPDAFNRILQRVKGRDVERLVNEVVLRSQAQAEYSPANFGHFGLNLRRYAHFTSPIRRYADLIVHRALIRAVKLGSYGLPDGADAASLTEIAANISVTERRAMKAERETADRLIAHFLADRIGATFDGHISGVTRAGLFVELDETGADGFIPARYIGDEYFRYNEAGRAFVGRSATYRFGDPVTVELVEAAPVAGALRFRAGARSPQAGASRRAGHKPPQRRKIRRVTSVTDTAASAAKHHERRSRKRGARRPADRSAPKADRGVADQSSCPISARRTRRR